MERELVKEIHEFLKNYGNYADLYMLDFYIEKQWSSIPKQWQSFFESKKDKIDDIALYILDTTNNKFDNEAPTTLLKIKSDIKNILGTLFTDKTFYQTGKCDFSKIPKPLLTKIKQKKLHELQYLVPLIKHLYTVSNSSFNQIVDYGAGIGHLSRILAYCLKDYVDVEISTVEGNDKFVEKSIELDKIFENKLKFLKKEVSNFKIERESKLISDNNDFSSQNGNISCKKLILGLHTCGDFASTLIKHYYINADAAALVNVGCCYHKLNNGSDMKYRQIYDATEDKVHENYSYPMSNEKDIFPPLSYAARELACHGLKQFKEKLNNSKNLHLSFKINLFRAKLEQLIFSITSEKKYRHLGFHSVPYSDNLSFEEYIEKALINQEEIIDKINLFKRENYEKFKEMIQININDIWKIFILYVIRLSIAPIIEVVILIDRIIFLKERGINSYLIDLFDQRISPRCYAIVSFKK